jgi:hypothetical protein
MKTFLSVVIGAFGLLMEPALTASISSNTSAGHTYELVSVDSPVTWFQAEDSAETLGGYLATVSSQEEQDLIAAQLPPGGNTWIGGTDVIVEGTWIWMTGESWSFTNWSPGEPSQTEGDDYLQIEQASGQWKSASGTALAFVVEWDCCTGDYAGNADCDDYNKVNLLDITRLIDYCYISGKPLCCRDEANIDGDINLNVNLLDIVSLINYVYDMRPPGAWCPSSGNRYPSHRIIIVDDADIEWDITNAVYRYGMDSAQFNFGLGPGGHPPVLNPEFLAPGDSGYPAPEETFNVQGVTINGESRAYPIEIMHFHEVVNDRFDSVYVAVAY